MLDVRQEVMKIQKPLSQKAAKRKDNLKIQKEIKKFRQAHLGKWSRGGDEERCWFAEQQDQ